MKDKIFTKEELRAIVWKEPISAIAKGLDLPDYEIRKACKIHKIPMPGYWQKVRANKKVVIQGLDAGYSGSQEIIIKVKQEKVNESIDQVKKLRKT